MARGFLSGLIWGGVAGLGVMGALSLALPLPVPPQVGDAAPGAGPAPARIRLTDVAEQDRLPETPPASSRPAPRADAPQQDDLAAVGPDAQTPASMPETGGAEGLSTPAAPAEGTPTQPEAEDPVLPSLQAEAPASPQPADELSISTEPAQPPAPEIARIEGAFDAPGGLQAPELGATEEITLPAEEVAPAEEPEPAGEERQAALDEEADGNAPVTTAERPPEAMAEEPQAPEAPLANDDPVQAPESALRPPEEDLLEQESPAEETAPAEPAAAEPADTAIDRPAIGTPAATLADRDTGVTVNRPGATVPEETVEAEEPAATQDSRPVVANSASVELDGEKPLMSVVLIDDGEAVTAGPAGLAALRSFPYPLSFAVDSSLPDAAERVARYRAAGFEVLAMVDLPQGAQPGDAETSLAVTLDGLPGIVGVLEGTEGGLQASRAVADQVSEILAQSGHGLVTQDKGLNTMPKLARKRGVPADPVFRDFDNKGQSARVIRRFLDQAAFKAGQEGAVIMLGRLRPDTISALLLWGLQDRASDVALVPISTVLLREE